MMADRGSDKKQDMSRVPYNTETFPQSSAEIAAHFLSCYKTPQDIISVSRYDISPLVVFHNGKRYPQWGSDMTAQYRIKNGIISDLVYGRKYNYSENDNCVFRDKHLFLIAKNKIDIYCRENGSLYESVKCEYIMHETYPDRFYFKTDNETYGIIFIGSDNKIGRINIDVSDLTLKINSVFANRDGIKFMSDTEKEIIEYESDKVAGDKVELMNLLIRAYEERTSLCF